MTTKEPAFFMGEAETAAYLFDKHQLSVSVYRLRKYRREGTGPVFRKPLVAIEYRSTDVDAWVEKIRSLAFTNAQEARQSKANAASA